MSERRRKFDSQNPEFLAKISRINIHFSNNLSVLDPSILDLIRGLPNPIVVDFNNVLANNIHPIVHNPDSNEFLESLRDIGTVVIMTMASDWRGVRRILREGETWSGDMVLMTPFNWMVFEEIRAGVEINRYLQSSLGSRYKEEDFLYPHKRVAPIFSKHYEVPLIDNDPGLTEGNPGMLGICVAGWEPDAEKEERARLDSGNTYRHSLEEALEKVREHYLKVNNG